MSSVGSLWDKGMEPIIRMMKTAGAYIEVPGVARLEYEWDDDGAKREWDSTVGLHRPDDGGDYVVYLNDSNAYGGAWFGVHATRALFEAIVRFAHEVDNFDPSWSDYLDCYDDASECLEDHKNGKK